MSMFKVMKIFVLLFLIFQILIVRAAYAEIQPEETMVADPYLEVHTGAASSFPIFYVVKRNDWIKILKRRTSWYQIRTIKESGNNIEGWVHRSQMAETLTPTGEKMQITDITRDNYLEHKWEVGMIGGDFEGSAIMTMYTDYQLTKNLAAEIALSQIIGNFSNRIMISTNLIHQPFPEWKVSPYFLLGAGRINTTVSATQAQVRDGSDYMAHAGLGIKMYLTRRFVLRADYQHNIIFQSRDDNEEIGAWQLGFAFFF